jgi:alanyl-tRNA synthetase
LTMFLQALDDFNRYFTENKDAVAYVASVDVDGNAKSLQTLIAQARKLEKAAYLFSVDAEGEKIAHVNFVPKQHIKPGFDAKTWAAAVTDVIGGKVSGTWYG